MNQEDMNKMMEALNAKLKELGEKTKDAFDTAVIEGMYAKDKLDEMMDETKSNVNSARNSFQILSERVKSKASAELLKAQMNIDVAKEQIKAKQEAKDKESLAKLIEEKAEYAEACADLAILASEEARLAALEVAAAKKEFEEKYGSAE